MIEDNLSHSAGPFLTHKIIFKVKVFSGTSSPILVRIILELALKHTSELIFSLK